MSKINTALEFDKLLKLAEQFVMFDESKHKLLNSKSLNDPNKVLELLTLVEQIALSKPFQNISLLTIESVEHSSKSLRIQNFTLEIKELLNIKNLVFNSNVIFHFAKNRNSALPEELSKYLQRFFEFKTINASFQRIFDKEYKIKDQASSALHRIRGEIILLNQSLYKQFKREVERYRKSGNLAEGEESVYNGRYVLRVITEHKRLVPGILVGESDGGRTAFIEPQSCVELNNKLLELEFEEGREIQKILNALSETCREQLSEIEICYSQLIDLDVLWAKAKFSLRLGGVRPNIRKEPGIKVMNGFHPLLLLKLKEVNSKPVPLNLELDSSHRMLIISGPNAGGKTLVLKSVGLFILMLKNGFLIPVHPSSEFFLFTNLFVDIGDHQSIENDLSTYTAKLLFMQRLLRNCNETSFILIDEFGTGTEPLIGGALAEAVLEELVKRKSFGVITTHYTNLKGIAHHTPGLMNGSMVFDAVQKKPMFQLLQGTPGSSYALEMAEKLNLPKRIINNAKKKMDIGVVHLEGLIANLKEEKNILAERNNSLQLKMDSLTKLMKAYDHMQKQNDLKRLKLKLESKSAEQENLVKRKDKMDEVLKRIEEKLDAVEARRVKEELDEKLHQTHREVKEIEKNIHQLTGISKLAGQVKTGDEVLIYKNNIIGIAGKISQGKVEVITDKFTIYTAIDDLIPVPKKNTISIKQRFDSDYIQRASSVKALLDIRGTTGVEASKAIEEYLDAALVSNLKEVRILHGKGSGFLRRNLLQAIKKNKFIKSYRHPDEQDGGLGVTIIEFV